MSEESENKIDFKCACGTIVFLECGDKIYFNARVQQLIEAHENCLKTQKSTGKLI